MCMKTIFTALIIFSLNALAQEHWQVKEEYRFSMWNSFFRTQGVTSDQQGHFWFSSWDSIIEANSKTGSAVKGNVFAIPIPLLEKGCDHIGDISYANGKIFAPIEDGQHYLHPHIGVFDANTLRAEKTFELPLAQQIDGVPWVAASGERHLVFSAEYSNMARVNVYDMDSMLPLGDIVPSQVLHSVQGGKYHDGFLYLTANSPVGKRFSIYKVNLDSGEVTEVGQLPPNLSEVEGLSFTLENGVQKIVVLGIVPFKDGASGIEGKLKRMALFTFAQN